MENNPTVPPWESRVDWFIETYDLTEKHRVMLKGLVRDIVSEEKSKTIQEVQAVLPEEKETMADWDGERIMQIPEKAEPYNQAIREAHEAINQLKKETN